MESKLIQIGDWLIDPKKVSAVGLGWSKEEPLRSSFSVILDGCRIDIRGNKEELNADRAKLINKVKQNG